MAELAPIHPSVAMTSPNLYDALQNSGANPQEMAMTEQLAQAYQKGLQLRKLDAHVAQNEYQKLSKPAQMDVKVLFPNDKYLQPSPSVLNRVEGVVKRGFSTLISPITSTFQAMGQYSKALNTVPRVAVEVAGGGPDSKGISVQGVAPKKMSPFAPGTWSTAFQGKDLYVQEDLDKLKAKYGEANIAVAAGLVAGKTPGEIMAGYKNGTWDDALGAALTSSLNSPKQFVEILDAVKLARFSPGRAAIRKAYNKDEKNGQSESILSKAIRGTLGNGPITIKAQGETDANFKKRQDAELAAFEKHASGIGDAIFQLAIDPLTYITAGGSKAGTLGERITNNIKDAAAKGNVQAGVSAAFKEASIHSLWEDTIGPAVKKFIEAPTPAAKAVAREEFRIAAPSHNNDQMLKVLSKNRIVNAAEAEEFFGHVENTHMFLSGRVDGTNYYRNGVATARSNRIVSQGLAASVDALFNPVIGKSSVFKTIEAADKAATPIVDILKKVGDAANQGINPDVVKLAKIEYDISKTQKMAFSLGQAFARSPGKGFIMYGDDAIKTIDAFRNVARLVLPRDLANAVAQHYLESNTSEQLTMVHNLYAAYMYKQGLAGSPKGEIFMQQELERVFNNVHGFGSSGTTQVPAHMAGTFSKHTVRWENDIAIIPNGGGRQPSQLTDAVGALDYMGIAKVRTLGGKFSFINGFDKVTQSAFLNGITNVWSFFTLIPRLGIRSASDELFMYLFQQPYRDVTNLMSRTTRQEQNFLTAVTSSKEAVGPMRRAMNIVFRKGGPESYLTLDRHADIINGLLKRLNKDGAKLTAEDLQHILIREEVAQRMWNVYVRNGVDPVEKEALINAVKHQPDFLNGTVSAMTSRTSLTGKFVEDEHLNPMFSVSSVDKAMEDVGKNLNGKGLKTGKKYTNVAAHKLERGTFNYPAASEADIPWWFKATQDEAVSTVESLLALAHFDNWGLRFAYNKMEIAPKVFFSPIDAFLSNNALKTQKNVDNAVKSLMRDIGVDWTSDIEHSVVSQKWLSGFINKFGDTATLRANGLTDVEIARTHIEAMLADQYIAFHGGREGFNEDLMQAIRTSYEDMQFVNEQGGPRASWRKAAAQVDFPAFEKLTAGKHPVQDGVNTRILFPGVTEDGAGFFARWGNKAFEQMDRQINNLMRQKAMLVTYQRIYKEYRPLMLTYAANMEKAMLEAEPFLGKVAKERALDMAEKRYTEIAMSDAAHTILKYADNPDIRSNLSVSLHTIGRFYRANEDFQRRIFRMAKEAPLRTLYRLRLLHTGLSASGFVYDDKQGNMYVVAPTDSVLFAPVSKAISAFYPDATDAFKSAQFDEVKMKLELVNPSFSQDAGQPMLSGPASAVSIWAVKAILNQDWMPQPWGNKAGTAINNVGLGSVGANISIRKAIVPMFIDTMYTMLNPNENSKELVTAFTQAASYLAAYGVMPPADGTNAKALKDYQDNLKIAAHSILVMRGLLGQISPATPTLQESKGVPFYYKAIGVTALRPEFYQILQGIKDNYPDNQDPYALATAIFIGKNPGKSVYLASRSNKNYQVLISANQNMQDWAIKNSNFVKTYGDAAYIFAPQVGKFNTNVYNWMQSQDLATLPSIDAYLANVQTSQAKAQYFAIGHWESDQLNGELNLSKRQQIIAQAKLSRDTLLAGDPMLKGQLGTNLAKSQANDAQTYNFIKQVVADKTSPINSTDRHFMGAAILIMDGFKSIVTDPEFAGVSNFNQIKLDERQKAEDNLFRIAKVNPAVGEAYQYVFKTILNQYAPDKNVVLSKGNG